MVNFDGNNKWFIPSLETGFTSRAPRRKNKTENDLQNELVCEFFKRNKFNELIFDFQSQPKIYKLENLIYKAGELTNIDNQNQLINLLQDFSVDRSLRLYGGFKINRGFVDDEIKHILTPLGETNQRELMQSRYLELLQVTPREREDLKLHIINSFVGETLLSIDHILEENVHDHRTKEIVSNKLKLIFNSLDKEVFSIQKSHERFFQNKRVDKITSENLIDDQLSLIDTISSTLDTINKLQEINPENNYINITNPFQAGSKASIALLQRKFFNYISKIIEDTNIEAGARLAVLEKYENTFQVTSLEKKSNSRKKLLMNIEPQEQLFDKDGFYPYVDSANKLFAKIEKEYRDDEIKELSNSAKMKLGQFIKPRDSLLKLRPNR